MPRGAYAHTRTRISHMCTRTHVYMCIRTHIYAIAGKPAEPMPRWIPRDKLRLSELTRLVPCLGRMGVENATHTHICRVQTHTTTNTREHANTHTQMRAWAEHENRQDHVSSLLGWVEHAHMHAHTRTHAHTHTPRTIGTASGRELGKRLPERLAGHLIR